MLNIDGKEWDTTTKNPKEQVWDGIWNSSVLNVEWQVAVWTLWIVVGELLGASGELSDLLSEHVAVAIYYSLTRGKEGKTPELATPLQMAAADWSVRRGAEMARF